MSGCLERKITDTGKFEDRKNRMRGENRNGDFNWDWSRIIRMGRRE